MKKILFCGGSHMGQCKKNEVIEKKFNNFDLDFYITGGSSIRDWSINGGRYKVDGTRITRIGGNIIQTNTEKDLSKYDHIVFIGQFIQIKRFCNPKTKQLLSKSILKEIFNKDSFINLPGNLYNEPLELFPKLAPNRVILIPDPLIKSKRYKFYFDFLDYFYKGLSLCCESRSIKLFLPDKSLLEDDSRFIKEEYKKDALHCNSTYWENLFKKFNYF